MIQQRLVSTPTAQLWTWGCNNPPAGELTPPELHLQPNTRRPHQVPEGWTRWLSNVENHGEKSRKAFGTLEGQVRQSPSCWSSPKMHYPQATPELRCHGDAVERLLHHTTPSPPHNAGTSGREVHTHTWMYACVHTHPHTALPWDIPLMGTWEGNYFWHQGKYWLWFIFSQKDIISVVKML